MIKAISTENLSSIINISRGKHIRSFHAKFEKLIKKLKLIKCKQNLKYRKDKYPNAIKKNN